MSAVRISVETMLTVYIIGLVALGGLFGRALVKHQHATAWLVGLLIAFVFTMFIIALVGLPPGRRNDG